MVVTKRKILDPHLDLICQSIESTVPEWELIDKLLEDIFQLPRTERLKAHAKGRIAECIVYNAVDHVRARYPNNVQIGLKQEKEIGRDWTIVPNMLGGADVYSSAPSRETGEIDLVTVTERPTVWEVKTGKFICGGNGVREKIIEALSEQGMARRVTPIRRYFETIAVRYMVVLAKDQIRIEQSSIQQAFVYDGIGILVPFYATRKQFIKDVQKNLL